MSAQCAIATAMRGLHYVLHAPQGDTYADLLFTMIERRDRSPAGYLHDLPGARPRRRHCGAVQDRDAQRLRALPAAGHDRRRFLHRRAHPGRPGRARSARSIFRSLLSRSNLPAYQKKENWGAAETFYRLVRSIAGRAPRTPRTAPGRSATFSAQRRSVFVTATTSAKSPACSTGSASMSA